MSENYEHIIYRRSACFLALIIVFVLSVIFAVISLLIIHPPQPLEGMFIKILVLSPVRLFVSINEHCFEDLS